MSIADKKYKELLKDILNNGVWDDDGDVRPVYENGTPAYSKSVFGRQIEFEQGEIPIITSKKVPVQSSINEVVHAFFRLKTVDLEAFRELGIGYWEEWKQKDDTLGRSYAYQLANQTEKVFHDKFLPLGWRNLDQVNAILHKLEHNPYSRRILFSYWRPDDVHRKALQECAMTGQFNVRDNKLDFLLIQRSVDTLLGLPSNWAGYYALQCAMANLFDYEVGRFVHQMGNVHLYDNQIELAHKVIDAPEYEQPKMWVNPEVSNFYDYTVDDIKVLDYKCGESIRSKVAI